MPQDVDPVPPASSRQTYLGGCDCSLIRYAIELDLAGGDVRTHSVWERSAPASCFRLLAGQEDLIGYQFSSEDAHHFFCLRCQTRVFSLRAPEDASYYSVDLKGLKRARLLYSDAQG